MVDHTRKFIISHLIVRLIAAINIAHLVVETLYPVYYRMLRQTNLSDAILEWYVISSLLLPLYVGFEAWWMLRKSRLEIKSLIIDTAFVILWFITLWGGALYVFTHSTTI